MEGDIIAPQCMMPSTMTLMVALIPGLRRFVFCTRRFCTIRRFLTFYGFALRGYGFGSCGEATNLSLHLVGVGAACKMGSHPDGISRARQGPVLFSPFYGEYPLTAWRTLLRSGLFRNGRQNPLYHFCSRGKTAL